MDIPRFRYMAWAKAHAARPALPLFMSGMPALSLEDLGLSASDVRLARTPGPGPDAEVAAAIAARYRVPPECVFPCAGTHQANYLLARSLSGPGTRVLCETPYYEALPQVFRLVGAEVSFFRRRREESWRLPIPEIRAALESGVRVVVLTDLHNPTGARLLPDEHAALEAAGREFGATILLDEVYRDFLPPPVGTGFLPGGPFVVSSSLTKVYGLGGLRIGWAFADPALVERLNAVNDLSIVNLPAPSASIALAAWERLEKVAARHRDVAARNGRVVAEWARGRKDLRWVPPEAGISAFFEVPALAGRDDVSWCDTLFEGSLGVVPGTMFDAPGGIRVGFGMATEVLREGLGRLGEALDALSASRPPAPRP